MNSTVYIFGNLSSGYTQYPEDYSINIFKQLYPKAKATTQLIVHREDNCMYYTYLRKLDTEKYIGLCVLLNDLMLTKLDRMFALFESAISKMVEKGYLIKYNNNGEIIANAEKLYMNGEEVEYVAGLLRFGFNNADNISRKLPPKNFGNQKNSTQEFSIKDDAEQILVSTYSYGYTFIYKSRNYNTAQMDSYKGVLMTVYKEKGELKKENERLQEQNRKILRQKKQFRNVIILALAVIGCGIGMYFLYDNLNNTQGQLDEANQSISQKNSTIKNKDKRIKSLQYSLDSLQYAFLIEHNTRKAVETNLTKVCSANPFVVTSCDVNKYSFNFNYYTQEDKTITLTLKAINVDDSEVVSNTHTITIKKGGGSKSLSFDYKLDADSYYYVALIYGNRIITGKYW